MFFVNKKLHKLSINLEDFAKTVFFGVWKLESVTFPYFSRLTSYFVGSGLGLFLIKLSLGCFFLIEYFELLAYFVILSRLGLY